MKELCSNNISSALFFSYFYFASETHQPPDADDDDLWTILPPTWGWDFFPSQDISFSAFFSSLLRQKTYSTLVFFGFYSLVLYCVCVFVPHPRTGSETGTLDQMELGKSIYPGRILFFFFFCPIISSLYFTSFCSLVCIFSSFLFCDDDTILSAKDTECGASSPPSILPHLPTRLFLSSSGWQWDDEDDGSTWLIFPRRTEEKNMLLCCFIMLFFVAGFVWWTSSCYFPSSLQHQPANLRTEAFVYIQRGSRGY